MAPEIGARFLACIVYTEQRSTVVNSTNTYYSQNRKKHLGHCDDKCCRLDVEDTDI